MDLNMFMGEERIDGFNITDGGRRACRAYAFDQDDQRFLVADGRTGEFSLLTIDEFVVDVTKKDRSGLGACFNPDAHGFPRREHDDVRQAPWKSDERTP